MYINFLNTEWFWYLTYILFGFFQGKRIGTKILQREKKILKKNYFQIKHLTENFK